LFKLLADSSSLMYKYILFLLLLNCYLPGYAQSGKIAGLVTAGDERQGSVSIRNISAQTIVYSNYRGEFAIRAKKGDTLIAIKDGFINDTLTFQGESSIIINLKKQPTMLKEVTINGKVITPEATYAANKKEYKDIYWKGDKSHVLLVTPIGVGLDIDKLFSMVSKQGKDARRMQRSLTKDYYSQVVDTRFNPLAARITGLKGRPLEDFISDNRPSYEMIARSSDYDIIQYIKRKMRVKKK